MATNSSSFCRMVAMNSPFIFGTDEMLLIVASDYPLFRFVKIFGLKVAVNTIVPRSPFFAFCTPKYRLL